MKTQELEKLARKAQRGEKEAFVALLEACKPSLLGVARSLLREEEDVADAMQETVLKAFEKLPELKKPAHCKTWLTRILLNNCYDILRGKKTVPIDPFSFPEEPVEYRWEPSMDVRAALDGVSSADRLMLVLFYVQDMSQRDIAKVLGITENAVKQRLARAKRHFKKSYERGEAVNE